MDCMITKQHANNMTAGRIRAIQEAPAPDYQKEVDRRECWIKMEITQHSPAGETKDTVMAYMAHDRSDSFNIKDGTLLVFKADGKGLFKAGTHRLMAWIAKNKLSTFGNV